LTIESKPIPVNETLTTNGASRRGKTSRIREYESARQATITPCSTRPTIMISKVGAIAQRVAPTDEASEPFRVAFGDVESWDVVAVDDTPNSLICNRKTQNPGMKVVLPRSTS
jgi:hypothetical protein